MDSFWRHELPRTAIVLALLSLAVPGVANAAEAQSGESVLRVGVQLGAVSSSIMPLEGPRDDLDSRTTFRAGVLVAFLADSPVSLETGLVVEGKGGYWTPGTRLDLTYLTLPVRVRAAPLRTDVRPFVSASFEASGLLSASWRRETMQEHRSSSARGGLVDGDAGLSAGAGLAFPLHGMQVSLELSFYRGLVDIRKPRHGIEGEWPGMQTRAWRLLLGVLL